MYSQTLGYIDFDRDGDSLDSDALCAVNVDKHDFPFFAQILSFWPGKC
jgi:hypothetical protein